MAGSPHCRTMDDLDDVTLELVFAYACAQHGGRAPAAYRPNPALPLVCKRWRAVYEHSSLLWEEVCVDCSAIARRCGTGLAHYAGRWVAARLPFCRRLVLAAFPDAPLPLGEVLPRGISSPRLLELHVLDATFTAGDAALALLRSCPALQRVAVAPRPCAAGAEIALVVQCESLVALGALPSLQCLELYVDKLVGSTANLSPVLSQLTHLAIRCRLESAALAPGLLEGLSQLKRLELGSVRLAQFTPSLAQALSGLTYLSGYDLLAARPRRRAGITLWEGLRHLSSLQQLRLEHQGGGGMPANALACRGLQGLTLIACAAEDWPATALHRYTGEGGCLRRLQSLHLSDLKLLHPIPRAIWRQLAPSLTALTWRDNRLPDAFEAAAAQAAAAADEAQALQAHLPDLPDLFQAVELPQELALLQSLRRLQLEYAQLDSVPASVQALLQLTFLSLAGNRLRTLPEGQYLTGLDELDLTNNSFTDLPEGLAACSSLRELQMGGCPLMLDVAAVEQMVAALPHLKRLMLPAAAPGVLAVGESTAALEAHAEGLRRLEHLLGPRLAFE